MSDNDNKVTKVIDHPLEEFFGIERGSTEVQVFERKNEAVKSEYYDDKDKEIDDQFQEIYDSAMDGYDELAEELHKVEGRYKARVGEVSVQHLNAALNAASHKARLKEHKDKLESKLKSGPSSVTTNNTLVVDDRSALLEQLRKSMAGGSDE
jgi:hypothetical protein